ncbi:hypothetical protein ACP4OV_031583 [Aristida adscensionis]
MMKGSGALNISGAMVLFIIVLLGGLKISAHCARVSDLTEGSRDLVKAEDGSSQNLCYETKCGRIPLPCFCCVSEYTPVRCWNAEDKCKRRCRPPSSALHRHGRLVSHLRDDGNDDSSSKA